MESKNIKFLVEDNRVGMAQEILSALASKNMNIIAMEISPPYISVKLEWDKVEWNEFIEWIKTEIKEILDVEEIDIMNSEKGEKELQIIINNMSDAIIAVNKQGKIEYVNSKASQLFDIDFDEKNIDINSIIPQEIYDVSLDIEDKDNIEVSRKIRNKKVNLLLNIKLIKNKLGIKTGSLLIFKEMDEVRKLIQTISRPSMISFEDIIGKSNKIQNTILLAKTVSKTEANIMILGESGTGKELFARAIHLNSDRCNGPFVAVNCSAVPDALLESEFFGYEKGAFTGASNTGKQGLFELATGGSIFLDEIAELPLHLQAKILRAIQEKQIRRIGGEKEIQIDARIISATHRDLESMVDENTFREDLYYRLNVIPVHIPSLRERKEDISILVDFFIDTFTNSNEKQGLKLTDEALSVLEDYSWPGNIRELQNVIERAVILSDGLIKVDHLMIKKVKIQEKETIDILEDLDIPVDLPKLIKELEMKYVIRASEKYNSSREIGKALGLSHTKIINILNQNSACK